ncbi:MAG: CvpA family protein [Treponema sp.]|jgi:membrane protein required for colicin V production|nr:CvpA family protein [Treponema sp.]
MNFNVMDVVFLLLIILLMIRCFLKGIISEFLNMSGFVFGLLASLFLYKNGAEFIRENFWPELEIIPEVIAFIALFLIVFIIIKLLEILLKGIIQGIRLGNVDKFFGIFFGFAEGIVLVSLILFLLRIQPFFDSSIILEDSYFANLLLPYITGIESIANV